MQGNIKYFFIVGLLLLIFLMSAVPVRDVDVVFQRSLIVGNYIFAGDIRYIEQSGDTVRTWVGFHFTTQYWLERGTFPDSVQVVFQENVFGRRVYVADAFGHGSAELENSHE
jgi:hypothetical protein